jgi:hypothetical protein
MGATRSGPAERPTLIEGIHTEAQALPETPARAITARSSPDTTSERLPRSGTETVRSMISPVPV